MYVASGFLPFQTRLTLLETFDHFGGNHSTFDDEREEKLLQPSAFVCAEQIELNSHLMLADSSHHSSRAEKRFGAVGHVEGDTAP
jgi:hypothetical protein